MVNMRVGFWDFDDDGDDGDADDGGGDVLGVMSTCAKVLTTNIISSKLSNSNNRSTNP